MGEILTLQLCMDSKPGRKQHSEAYGQVLERVMQRAKQGTWGKTAAFMAVAALAGSALANPAYAALSRAPATTALLPLATPYTGPTSYQELEAPDARLSLAEAKGSTAGMVPYTYVPATGVRTEQSRQWQSVADTWRALPSAHEKCRFVVQVLSRLMDVWGRDKMADAQDLAQFTTKVRIGSDGSIKYKVRPGKGLKPLLDNHVYASSEWNRAIDTLKAKLAEVPGEEAAHIRDQIGSLRYGTWDYRSEKYDFASPARRLIVDAMRQYLDARPELLPT